MIDLNQKISCELTEKLKDCAVRTYPYECCGVLLGKREKDGLITIKEVRPAVNRVASEKKETCFIIDPMEIYGIEKEEEQNGLDIVGFFHSHPDKPAVFSEEDKKYMIPGQIYVLISVSNAKCVKITSFYKS